MNLQQFEKLLSVHLPPHKVRRIIRIYLETAGEKIDGTYTTYSGFKLLKKCYSYRLLKV